MMTAYLNDQIVRAPDSGDDEIGTVYHITKTVSILSLHSAAVPPKQKEV